MPYFVSRRHVVNNDLLMAEITSNTIPELGWEYHYDGQDTYVYRFATWESSISTDFPPALPSSGSIKSIYWYLKTGGSGPGSDIVTCFAMFLGDSSQDAFFNQDNPISTVNSQQWSGTRQVSTADGAIDVTPKSQLNNQYFKQWIPLWGACQAQGSHLLAPDNADGAAVAVYGPPEELPPFEVPELVEAVRGIIDKIDTVADFLDERYRKIIDVITSGDAEVQDRMAEALKEVKVDPIEVRKKLLGVRADIRYLTAMEEILNTLVK